MFIQRGEAMWVSDAELEGRFGHGGIAITYQLEYRARGEPDG